MEISKKTIRNLILGAMGCIVLYWLMNETERVRSVLDVGKRIFSPFIVGAVIAFILNVPVRGVEGLLKDIQKPGLRRGAAICITFLLIILVIAGVILLLLPQLQFTIETLLARLPGFFSDVKDFAIEILDENPEIKGWLKDNTNLESLEWGGIIEKGLSVAGSGLSTIINGAVSAIGTLTSGLFNAIVSLIFALYCLGRKEILARQCRRLLYSLLPEKTCDEIIRIMRLTNSTFSNFISGQCLEAVILASLFAVCMAIFGMPYIPLICVLIAITALVPIVGAFAGCILGALFILVESPILAVWFVIMFLVIQQFEGNVIYPRVVGTSVGLPGMWVLLAVAVGGELMGVVGMFLFIPLISVIYALTREFTQKRLADRNIPEEKLMDHPPELKSKFKEIRQQRKEKRMMQQMKDAAEKLVAELHHEKKEK